MVLQCTKRDVFATVEVTYEGKTYNCSRAFAECGSITKITTTNTIELSMVFNDTYYGNVGSLTEVTITVNSLIRRGLRSKYHSVEGNEKSFKGRIMFNEHIRQNFIHKERIYVEYETYSQDRPENRLIKSTMEALIRRTEDGRNKKGLKTLVAEMEEIPSSDDVDRDFSRCVMDRNMVDYEGPMVWCNIFLRGMGLGIWTAIS